MKKITLKIFKSFLLIAAGAILLEAGTRAVLYVSLNNYINRNIPASCQKQLKQIHLFPVISLNSQEIKFDSTCYYIMKEGFFRGPDDNYNIPKTKKNGQIRIMAVGDSTTYGIAVGCDESWPALLEESLKSTYPGKEITVLNAGIPGASSRQLKRVFQKYLIQYNPDIVIWRKFATLSDSYELKDDKTWLRISLWRLLYESRVFRTACLLIDKGRDWKTATANKVFDFITNHRNDEIGPGEKEIDFSLVKRLAQENSVPYVLAVDYIENSNNKLLSDYPRYRSHEAGPVVRTFGAFKETLEHTPVDDVFIDDCHLTETGTRVIAKEVRDFIVGNRWIDSLGQGPASPLAGAKAACPQQAYADSKLNNQKHQNQD